MYEQEVGPIPPGFDLDHLCSVTLCVRPDHLDPVSHAVNLRRGRGTKLTADQVVQIRADSRTCRDIALDYDVSAPHISKIKSGRKWAA